MLDHIFHNVHVLKMLDVHLLHVLCVFMPSVIAIIGDFGVYVECDVYIGCAARIIDVT